MTPLDAIEQVKKSFPFENYIDDNLTPYLTVGETVEKYLPSGSKVFDLGSGPCDKTAIAQVLGMHCTAVDDLMDDWHLRGDNRKKIETFAKGMGIEFSREYTPLEEKYFDMVMLNDVLEHIHDSPRDLMNSLVAGLKEGAYLFVTVPNLANIRKRLDLMRGRTNLPRYDLYYWYKGPWRGPQREYTRGDLVSFCNNLGVDIVELTTTHHMLQNLPVRAHSAYKLATRVFPDWRDTWVLVARKPKGWQPRHELSEAEFAQIYGQASKKSLYR